MKHALSVLILFAVTLPAAAAGDWKKSLKETLDAEYRPTKIGISFLTFDYNRITQPGAVLVVRVPGIYADLADTKQAILRTTIQDGRAIQQKGFAAALSDKAMSRQLKPNETVYVLNNMVKDDGIQFELLTTEVEASPINGSHRYRAMVFFPFPKTDLPTVKLEDIRKVVDPIFATAEVANAVQTKTVRLGMTFDQVKKILGNPSKIIDLGAKQTYVYPDMKIVFKDGAVADVQ